jgi:Ca2+-binding RTX toxin-like protein
LQDRTSGLYDTVIEDANGGNDFVYITAIAHLQFGPYYALTANVEGGQILGTIDFNLDGNDTDNRLFGNSGANVLRGFDGDDKLVGAGGDDTLYGGNGDDTYFLEDLIGGDGVVLTHYDAVVEDDNGGIDTVEVLSLDNLETFSDGYTLGANIENGEITGSLAFDLEGNELANKLTGNGAVNLLSGMDGDDTLIGGAGGDTLDGGAGTDLASYERDQAGVVVSLANPSLNTGSAAGDQYISIEGLIGSDFNDTLTGDSGNNTIYGRSGNDTIDGGAGADFMSGGLGDDTFIVDNVGDVAGEGQHGGTDRVRSSISYALGGNLENLTLLGSANLNGSGNLYANEIQGNSGNNVLKGFEGADRLFGNLGNDTLNGGTGDDTLDGGAGVDTAVFSGNRASYTVTDLGNGSVRVVGADGTDTLTGIERLQFADRTISWPLNSFPESDFSGDNISDILWRSNTGQIVVWQLNSAGKQAAGTTIGTLASSWHVEDTGDFNGDGKADILWRNDSGQIALWKMDGSHVIGTTDLGKLASVWNLQGTADVGGDGSSDLVWRNSTNGNLAIWNLTGSGQVTAMTSLGTVSKAYHIQALDDFNGDGKDDILWRNDNGQVALWQMNGSSVASATTVSTLSSAWHIQESGDFNGDGKADILWRSDAGQVAVWFMDGAHVASATAVSTLSNAWQVETTGDFNGDGKTDILWRNTTTGQAAEWLMNGSQVAGTVDLGKLPTWDVQHHQFDIV